MRIIDWNEYQDFTDTTAIYPNPDSDLNYPVLGLNSEAGEVADKLKKVIRDKGGIISTEDEDEIAKELGDVLWYIARCARAIDYKLEDIMALNVRKLSERKERDVICGSGDNR